MSNAAQLVNAQIDAQIVEEITIRKRGPNGQGEYWYDIIYNGGRGFTTRELGVIDCVLHWMDA